MDLKSSGALIVLSGIASFNLFKSLSTVSGPRSSISANGPRKNFSPSVEIKSTVAGASPNSTALAAATRTDVDNAERFVNRFLGFTRLRYGLGHQIAARQGS